MADDPSTRARRVRKLMNNGALAPEDLTRKEFSLLKSFYPDLAEYVQTFLELRHEKIQAGEWTEEHEPPKTRHRFRRYENGDSMIDKWEPDDTQRQDD